LSAHRTFSLAVTRFFWEGMYRDIEQYIRSCIPCQTRARSHGVVRMFR
jgi:hypothetical protein